MPPPLHHLCLNRLDSKFIPNHRTDRLVEVGYEETLLSAAIIVAAGAEQLERAELSDWWHNGICAPVWNHPTLEPTTRAPTTGARHGKTLG